MAQLNDKRRVLFPAGKQTEFLNQIQKSLNLNVDGLARIVGVHARTIRDWKREKFLISIVAVQKLSKESGVVLPKNNLELKEPFWYTKKGAVAGGMACYKKYGSLNSKYEEKRKRKWQEWWDKTGKFCLNPYFSYKEVQFPKNSVELAEFVGILLGDGGITKSQISITLNMVDDREFSFYVKKLIKGLFSVIPSISCREEKSILNIVISRKKLVDYLCKMGLYIGSKVRNQTRVPIWINESEDFIKACVRGLLDTDGCFFVDKHKYRDKIYHNCGLNFTNRSIPILNFFKNSLTRFGYHPTQKTKFSVFLRRESEVIRYFEEIGSSNPKHYNKFLKYLENKIGEVG